MLAAVSQALLVLLVAWLLRRWQCASCAPCRQQQQQQRQHTDACAVRDNVHVVSSAPALVDDKATATIAAQQAATTTTRAAEVLIAYASHSQNAYALAHRLFSVLLSSLPSPPTQHTSSGNGGVTPRLRVVELREGARDGLDVEALLAPQRHAVVIFVVSTYTDGAAPPRSQSFELLLRDAYEDHRVARDTLRHTRFAVFGLGDAAYGAAHYNAFAKHLHTWCRGLGAPPCVVPPVYASEATAQRLFDVFATALQKWLTRVEFAADGTVRTRRRGRVVAGGGDDNKGSARDATRAAAQDKQDDKACDGDDDDSDDSDTGTAAADGDVAVDDVEDVVWDGQDDADDGGGGGGAAAAAAADGEARALPELLYPRLRDNLRKQGYRLVGSHSGVKLCRWTKAMLRGRGGCYKHTFYNISSAQCMEMTPSLACANKCVFCWRHHTNPVSRSFRWRQDAPEAIVAQCIAEHAAMVRQLRGVPGVTPERLREATRIRHCALSLVGEPIMYPQINTLCALLHAQHISTFMVTNAQFPEQLRQLQPVVQLYLSIDAPTPEELKRIDRPLFEDYWERCLACVQALRAKRQRTVFRLTLVNQYNCEHLGAYAELVQMGWPDFIEVKGVTYCGTSNGSTLTMREHVPRHDEVVAFCAALCSAIAERNRHHASTTHDKGTSSCVDGDMGSNNNNQKDDNNKSNGNDKDDDDNTTAAQPSHWPYRIACEHEHSCCVLIARDTFYYDGCWHTWIDYDRFFALVESRRDEFTSLDYAAPTPSWATYNSAQRGFDPAQSRVQRHGPRPTAATAAAAAAAAAAAL